MLGARKILLLPQGPYHHALNLGSDCLRVEVSGCGSCKMLESPGRMLCAPCKANSAKTGQVSFPGDPEPIKKIFKKMQKSAFHPKNSPLKLDEGLLNFL